MIEIGDKIEYGGELLRVVSFFDQPTVVLEDADGERVTVAMSAVIYNLMRQIRDEPNEARG
jgi:hypothetical protein